MNNYCFNIFFLMILSVFLTFFLLFLTLFKADKERQQQDRYRHICDRYDKHHDKVQTRHPRQQQKVCPDTQRCPNDRRYHHAGQISYFKSLLTVITFYGLFRVLFPLEPIPIYDLEDVAVPVYGPAVRTGRYSEHIIQSCSDHTKHLSFQVLRTYPLCCSPAPAHP